MQAEEARKNAPAKVTHLTEEKAESAVKDRRQQEAYSEEYPQASEEFLRFWGLNTTVSFPSSEELTGQAGGGVGTSLGKLDCVVEADAEEVEEENDDVQWMLDGNDIEPSESMEELKKTKYKQLKRLKRDIHKIARNLTFEEMDLDSEEQLIPSSSQESSDD
eukprot:767444-Hanusia_phi.AAC.17